MPTAAPATMPARGNEDAPSFDPEKPCTLRRFFEDLEMCFDLAGIKDNKQKKMHARRYVDVDVQDLWTSLKAYSEAAQTYEDFKKAVYRFYPGAEDTTRRTLADLMRVVDHRKNIGLATIEDLANYYRQFVAISAFLRETDRISKNGETRRFMEGFPAHMAERVKQRLQVLHPHHDQDEEHTLADVEQAAEYVLHGKTNESRAATTSAMTAAPPTIINTCVDIRAQAIAEAFSNQTAPRAQRPAYPQIQAQQQQQGNGPPQNAPREENPDQPNFEQLVYGVCQDRDPVQTYQPRATTNTYTISLDEHMAAWNREMDNIVRARRQRANEEAQRATSEAASSSIQANHAPTPQVSQPAPRPSVDHHRPTDPSRPPALESVQAKTVKKVASADLPQHVNFPATASRSPRRSFVPPSIAAQTDREVPPHRKYDSTPRARELDHAFVVDSPDRPPYEHAVPHVSPLHPAPRTTPAARPLAPEIDKPVPQGRPRQSNARACESDHAIEVDRPHWRSEATCDPLDSTPCPAPGPHSIAPRLGTRVPHDRSNPQMPRAYESDHAVTIDEPVIQQPMATEPYVPLDSVHRPAMRPRPVAPALHTIVVENTRKLAIIAHDRVLCLYHVKLENNIIIIIIIISTRMRIVNKGKMDQGQQTMVCGRSDRSHGSVLSAACLQALQCLSYTALEVPGTCMLP